MAEQSPPINQAHRRARPETSAWLLLLVFFLVFCTLVASIGFFGWRSYTGALEKVDGSIVRVHVRAGVTYQAKGSTKKITPDEACKDNPPGITDVCVELNEGDHVQALPDAGYGPVASIKLRDSTQVDMWAHPTGADVTLQTYVVSRWSGQQQVVVFNQTAGYARYDIPPKDAQPYADVSYMVVVSNTNRVTLALAPGGSYSVNVPHEDANHSILSDTSGKPLLVEVAVRTGSVEVQTGSENITAGPDHKIQVDTDRVASDPLPARWELIRDGDFNQLAAEGAVDENTVWSDYFDLFDSTVPHAEQNGKFKVLRACRPDKPAFCSPAETTNIGQFERAGDQHKSYGKGIQQILDADVSEYRSLHFSMHAIIIQQSISQAGIANSECAVTVQFVFKQKNQSDPERHYLCVYKADSNKPQIQNTGDYTYQGVPPSQWYSLEYDLRDFESLNTAYYLQRIIIYANGHDYISAVTDISLDASQRDL